MTWQFRAELWLHPGEGAWHFITLPLDVATEIREMTAGRRRGFGSVRVAVEVGATSWGTSVFPDSASGSFLLPVKREVRTSEGLGDGDSVEVALRLVEL